MKLKEKTGGNMSSDYWFLRDNQVCAKTVLKMLGKAYMEEKK